MLTQFQSLAPKEERSSMSPSSLNGTVPVIMNDASDAGSHVRCEVSEIFMQLCLCGRNRINGTRYLCCR